MTAILCLIRRLQHFARMTSPTTTLCRSVSRNAPPTVCNFRWPTPGAMLSMTLPAPAWDRRIRATSAFRTIPCWSTEMRILTYVNGSSSATPTIYPSGKTRRSEETLPAYWNQIIGNWQVAGITIASTGNWYTPTDISTNLSTSDGGGEVASASRPNVVGNPNGHPCVQGTLFNTCAFATNTVIGSFGDAGRNIIQGPGVQTGIFLYSNFSPSANKSASSSGQSSSTLSIITIRSSTIPATLAHKYRNRARVG